MVICSHLRGQLILGCAIRALMYLQSYTYRLIKVHIAWVTASSWYLLATSQLIHMTYKPNSHCKIYNALGLGKIPGYPPGDVLVGILEYNKSSAFWSHFETNMMLSVIALKTTNLFEQNQHSTIKNHCFISLNIIFLIYAMHCRLHACTEWWHVRAP